ncbi:MAG: metallophosphoesterase [Paludibacteraceae bacterium]
MTTDGVTVFSIVNKPCVSYICYGETEQLGSKLYPSHGGAIDANLPIQKVRLSGLTAGKRYYYRIVSKEITQYQPYKVVYGDSVISPLQPFTLPRADVERFSFLAFNDVHSQPAFIDTVCKRFPDIDFVCYNGDILSDIRNEQDIVTNLCNASAKAFAGSKPFLYVRGNHETRGAASRSLMSYIENPENEYYYNFKWGNTQFLVLDTGEDKEDTHPVYAGLADYDPYRSKQAEWLKTVIASKVWKKAKHRVALSHIPASSQGDGWHGTNEVAQKLLPVLNSANIDMYLCGHTHEAVLERPDKNHAFALVIGGGPVYDKSGIGTTYIRVIVDGKQAKIELYKKDGTLYDSYLTGN